MKIKRHRTASILHITLLSVMLVMVLGSCTKESLLPDDQLNGEYADFSLKLTPPGVFTPIDTRALTAPQQNAINSAEVLVFKNNILLYTKTGSISVVDGASVAKVELKTSQTANDIYDILVIGNPPVIKFDTYLGKTKDELKAGLNVTLSGKWAGSEFIMYGEILQTLIKPSVTSFGIQMIRSLARVDIGVGTYDRANNTWAGLPNFSLTSITVVNSRDKFAVIPSATTLSSTGNVKVSDPTIPSGTKLLGSLTYTEDIASVDGRGAYSRSSIFLAEAPNTTDRVTLIIEGKYNGGATTYYRVDMCIPSKDSPGGYDYLNILRNHIYRINITSISGSGFATAAQALLSAPFNITTELTPIEEGKTGDVVFDGNNYIFTDVSQVMIYGVPDGIKSYTIATVKANFNSGVTATITGLDTPVSLESGVPKTISVKIPAGIKNATYTYTITVGRLIKKIQLTVQPPIDAHFDFLPFQNVASITISSLKPWLTLSNNMTYVKGEQQSAYITGNAQGKAVIHFDENIATTGAPRTAEVLVLRNNNLGTTRVYIEQLNLSGMVMGQFGGAKDNQGYTQQLAVESVEEFSVRIYDDTSIGTANTGMQWGFNTTTTSVTDRELGKAGTITLTKLPGSGITAPYSIYNNYAAHYCYDKNRDTDGNGTIDDNEVLWYLPAQNQLMGAWIVSAAIIPFERSYHFGATEGKSGCCYVDFSLGSGSCGGNKRGNWRVRCVRDLMP